MPAINQWVPGNRFYSPEPPPRVNWEDGIGEADHPPAPCRTITVTDEMRAQDAAARAEREARIASTWSLKGQLSEENLRRRPIAKPVNSSALKPKRKPRPAPAPTRLCSLPLCGIRLHATNVRADGLCGKHAVIQDRRAATAEKHGRVAIPIKAPRVQCVAEGCAVHPTKHRPDGLCGYHGFQKDAVVRAKPAQKRPAIPSLPPQLCIVEGCQQRLQTRSLSDGLCSIHRRRLRRAASTARATLPRCTHPGCVTVPLKARTDGLCGCHGYLADLRTARSQKATHCAHEGCVRRLYGSGNTLCSRHRRSSQVKEQRRAGRPYCACGTQLIGGRTTICGHCEAQQKALWKTGSCKVCGTAISPRAKHCPEHRPNRRRTLHCSVCAAPLWLGSKTGRCHLHRYKRSVLTLRAASPEEQILNERWAALSTEERHDLIAKAPCREIYIFEPEEVRDALHASLPAGLRSLAKAIDANEIRTGHVNVTGHGFAKERPGEMCLRVSFNLFAPVISQRLPHPEPTSLPNKGEITK